MNRYEPTNSAPSANSAMTCRVSPRLGSCCRTSSCPARQPRRHRHRRPPRSRNDDQQSFQLSSFLPFNYRRLDYKAAVEAGKHVFMEKPCCVDAGGYRSLMETNRRADEKGLKVGVGHSPHYLEKEHIDLLEAVWTGKSYNEGWSGATSSFTGILGREASYSGQVVKWDELAQKGPSLRCSVCTCQCQVI